MTADAILSCQVKKRSSTPGRSQSPGLQSTLIADELDKNANPSLAGGRVRLSLIWCSCPIPRTCFKWAQGGLAGQPIVLHRFLLKICHRVPLFDYQFLTFFGSLEDGQNKSFHSKTIIVF